MLPSTATSAEGTTSEDQVRRDQSPRRACNRLRSCSPGIWADAVVRTPQEIMPPAGANGSTRENARATLECPREPAIGSVTAPMAALDLLYAAGLTSIFFASRRAVAGFVTVIVRTPLAMLALTSSGFTPSGNATERQNDP